MAIVVILIGVLIFSAAGGGWVGGILIALLFAIGLLIKNPGPVVYAFTKSWYRGMSPEKRAEHLADQCPDIDWAAQQQNSEVARNKAEHAGTARCTKGETTTGSRESK